jgi:hypothetical protein
MFSIFVGRKKHYAIKDRPEEVLYYDSEHMLGYKFFAVAGETINCWWTIKYYETSTEAEKLLINLMNKHKASNDNVVFSTEDL